MAEPTPKSSGPSTLRSGFETVHAVAAGLWLGALVMAGATAGLLFTHMRTLEPAFGVFENYAGDQSNIGAGFLQNRVFLALDFVQYGSATLALFATIGIIVLCKLPIRRASSVVRLLALGSAMILVSYHLFVLTPRMQENAQQYWSAAEAGENESAATAYAAFDADHPRARQTLMGLTVAVLALLASGAWSAASSAGERPDPPTTPRSGPRTKADGREEPRLASRGGRS